MSACGSSKVACWAFLKQVCCDRGCHLGARMHHTCSSSRAEGLEIGFPSHPPAMTCRRYEPSKLRTQLLPTYKNMIESYSP